MITHEKATMLNSQLAPKGSKLAYPSQNLVDLIWLDKPPKPKKLIYIHSTDFAGKEASAKLQELRDWIEAQPANVPGFSKSAEPKPAQKNIGILITSLSCIGRFHVYYVADCPQTYYSHIAYLLNLRGDDIPFNPVFHAYLYVSLVGAVLFIDKSKVDENVGNYLAGLGVSLREYSDIWPFLRKREYGDGRVLLSSQTPYAISLMLTHFRYTIAPAIIEEWKAVKNEIEIDGLRRAYLRDGAAFVRL
jgi:Xaa-Pro aminopeptidase